MLPGLERTCPRSTSVRSTPRSRQPTLSPACPSSSVFWNISTPVTITLRRSPMPTTSISSPVLTLSRSPRPGRLLEHLDAGDNPLAPLAHAHDLDLITRLDDAALDPARDHGAPPL